MSAIQAPRGTHDWSGSEWDQYHAVIDTALECARQYGFGPVETPIFEHSNVFHRSTEMSDMVSKETYDFTDRGGDSLTLRPEGTASVVRALIEHSWHQQVPAKFFYHGPMFRYERPQKGRYRQFHQFGIEYFGGHEVLAESECISYAHSVLKRLKADQHVKLKINTLGGIADRSEFMKAFTAFLKPLAQKLSPDSQRRLDHNPLRILDSKNPGDQELCRDAPKIQEFLSADSLSHFSELKLHLSALQIEFEEDPQLVRGLDYYDHTVFEFVTDQLGTQNAVISGGRYNRLVSELGGPDLGAVGLAAGVERLRMLSQVSALPQIKIGVIVMEEQARRFALRLVNQLRDNGRITDWIEGGNLSKRFKKADRMQATHVILIGEEEYKSKKLVIKNLSSGHQQVVTWPDLEAGGEIAAWF